MAGGLRRSLIRPIQPRCNNNHNQNQCGRSLCLPLIPDRRSTLSTRFSTPPAIEIRSLAPGDDTTAFRTLNEEWITEYFKLEAKDREILNDPVRSILLKGGHIFMAYAAAEAVGCVALIPMQDGVRELSKMAVSPHLRGRGLGRRLLQHAITQARSIRAKSLFLGDAVMAGLVSASDL